MIIHKLLYLYQLKKNLRLEPSRLQDMQRKKLKVMMKHAYENVPFYRRKFDRAGIKPDDINSVADVSKVPCTTRAEIQGSPFEDVTARNVNINRGVKITTSGSTGIPLTIIRDKAAEDFGYAVHARAWFENGLRPLRDKMAVIGHPRFLGRRSMIDIFGINRRKYISVFNSAERQLRILENYKPNVIKGYSSSLAILADLCRNKASNVKPRLVFAGSELLSSRSRELISSALECELLDYYACNEFGLLAWECCEHMGYHMNVENVAMEFVKNGEAVGPGERGEIVCTDLVNYAMPLIRYRLGDVGVPSEEQCSCDRTLPLLKMIEGRTDDFLTTSDGRVITGQIFSENYPFEDWKREGIKQFRVIQERKDKLTIELAVRESVFDEVQVLEKARRELQELFGEGMHIEFQIKEEIEKDPTGKIRVASSQVPVHWADSLK